MQHKAALAEINAALLDQGYISDASIAMALHLSRKLKKPLLVEGPAGVGKTEIAKVMAKVMATQLIRLQCYEGIDAPQALYEWNYQHQLLHLKMLENEAATIEQKESQLFSEKFLQKRPLLEALQTEESSVLLIDEIDRADEEFESFLLEMLSDWQITIPEIGTMPAKSIPQVILTSNRVRELSEALRRRCLYLYIDYPSFEKEVEIVTKKVPEINGHLAREISAFMQALRKTRLEKIPGVAETLDWATALAEMHFDHLDKSLVESTLGVVLKDWDDMRSTQDSLSELFEKVRVKLKVE